MNFSRLLIIAPVLAASAVSASAQTRAAAAAGSPKSILLEKSDDWGAYAAQTGKDKLCYALAQPKDRLPAEVYRDESRKPNPAYFYIWIDPSKNVRNEISVIFGFSTKAGTDATATIGGSTFAFVTKEGNGWLKNPAESSRFIDAMRKGDKMLMKMTSARGTALTDSYSLSGIATAVARAAKECP